MGISDKMRGLAIDMQEGVKSHSISLFSIILRLISGFFLGLTLGFVAQELLQFGTFLLMFSTFIVTGLFMRFSA